MEVQYKHTMSTTESSDTIIEVKTAVDSNSTAHATKIEEVPQNNADEHSDKKSKPPPLDVTAAQELQQQGVSGPKTPTSGPPITPNQILDRQKLKERKIGHRRVNEEGEITFKKIQTSQIMGSIQLGISHAVGSLASKPERDLLMQDFTIVETTFFPHDGSNLTPAHRYSDFRFKAYAPVAFRYFRDLFGIQKDDFLLSLCNYPLRELTNPGASGSIFYLTDDDEFIIKTVQHKEAEFLQKLLPGYYMNLNQNPRTLLPKFFGLYCYQCGGKNIRLAIMNNLLPSIIQLHEKFDLKGSTYKRKANKQERKKNSPTYKDLDFMQIHSDGILLESETYTALTRTISRDCLVLESFKIMDYSLLVGVHNLDLAKQDKIDQRRREQEELAGKLSDDSESASPNQAASGAKSGTTLVRSKSMNKQRLAAFSTAMESIQAEIEAAELTEQDDDVPPGGIPAKNSKGENLLLFLGIIDILQSFRLAKKLEHTWKAVLHDGDTVSVHRPGFYAQRFQDFMGKNVFRKKEIGPHRKFKTVATSVLALKHSPSKKRVPLKKHSGPDSETMRGFLPKIPSESEGPQGDESATEASKEEEVTKSRKNQCANTASMPPSAGGGSSKVTWDKTEVISLSQVIIQTDTTIDCLSETSSCSTSGHSATVNTVTWTPPHSAQGSTPTHTEGTPSFTESSSSGDAACPTTPVRSINKSLDSLP